MKTVWRRAVGFEPILAVQKYGEPSDLRHFLALGRLQLTGKVIGNNREKSKINRERNSHLVLDEDDRRHIEENMLNPGMLDAIWSKAT